LVKNWVPGSGEVIWVDLDPVSGHEQAGHRPCLVLSPASYNDKSGLLIACAMTTVVKGYPWEVKMPDGAVILADAIKSLDWRTRRAKPKGTANAEVLNTVRAYLKILLQI
jgi:mRNA interferase MazF